MREDVDHQETVVQRLIQAYEDDPFDESACVSKLDLAHELESRIGYQKAVNKKIATALDEVETWRGFTGVKNSGITATSSTPSEDVPVSLPSRSIPVSHPGKQVRMMNNDSDTDEDLEEEAERLESVIARLE